ncbi:unnamed protein product [Trifolium pratense]|uniref:Uncharacterized protein n=1 Tax=Trifolium pratense TaxID=57577 RepID=A0ACB0IHN8_TRIPR|nr:unnamed protein product [Trifolium pratense]
MDAGWFYQICTRCASRINFIAGQLYCDKCKMPRTTVPRLAPNVHPKLISLEASFTMKNAGCQELLYLGFQEELHKTCLMQHFADKGWILI